MQYSIIIKTFTLSGIICCHWTGCHCSVKKPELPVKVVNLEHCFHSGLLKELIHCLFETGSHLTQSYLFHAMKSTWLPDSSCGQRLRVLVREVYSDMWSHQSNRSWSSCSESVSSCKHFSCHLTHAVINMSILPLAPSHLSLSRNRGFI